MLDKATGLNFEHDLQPVEDYFTKLEHKIQDVVNRHRDGLLLNSLEKSICSILDANTRIQEAKDTVERIKKDLDKQINDFNFNDLRDGADYLKEKSEQYRFYITGLFYVE